MSANFHPLVYVVDYVLGVIMWTLIGRVAMNIFQREDSEFFFMKTFVKLTNPLINVFRPITPSFLVGAFSTIICSLVLLHGTFLFNALFTWLFSNGYAFFSFRK